MECTYINMSTNFIINKYTKHIDVKHYIIRYWCKKDAIDFTYTGQLTDLMTKFLARSVFVRHRTQCMPDTHVEDVNFKSWPSNKMGSDMHDLIWNYYVRLLHIMMSKRSSINESQGRTHHALYTINKLRITNNQIRCIHIYYTYNNKTYTKYLNTYDYMNNSKA